MLPFVNLAAYCYTHPKTLLWAYDHLIPGPLKGAIGGLMDEKHVKLFEPRFTVKFHSVDGIALQGHWMPAKNMSEKTVILAHGYFADWRNMLLSATTLRNNGFNVFLFDFRGHGDSGSSKTTIGYHEGKDIAGAVRFLSDNYPQESKNLFYMGHSMGAAAMLMAAQSLKKDHATDLAFMNQRIKAYVLDSSFSSFPKMVDRFVNNLDTMNPDNKILSKCAAIVGIPLKKFAKNLIEGFRFIAPSYANLDITFDELKPGELYVKNTAEPKPMLVIHGTHDNVTPYEQGLELFETLKAHNPKVEMLTLEGADHVNRSWDPANTGELFTASQRNDPEYSEKVLSFLKSIRFGGLRLIKPTTHVQNPFIQKVS